MFESNLEDYPANALLVFNDLTEYMNEMRSVWWINEKEYIVNVSEELLELGFHFTA